MGVTGNIAKPGIGRTIVSPVPKLYRKILIGPAIAVRLDQGLTVPFGNQSIEHRKVIGGMELAKGINRATLAFRGYNVENLGRTTELLAIPEYRPILEKHLNEASHACSEIIGRNVDLVARVKANDEPSLEEYAEAIALVIAVELAHLDILETCHNFNYRDVGFSFGFSLGEIAALIAGGTFEMKDALRIPLMMSADGIDLAKDVTLGILFCRREILDLKKVRHILLEINTHGEGVIGISTHLGPNSVLVMGSGNTIELLRGRLKEIAPKGVHLRCNSNRWPPLHTPIVWNKDFTSRAARMMHTLPGGFVAPTPPILSLVTGKLSYDDFNAREHMIKWVDQTQLLWDAVNEVLSTGIRSVIHVGPAPNIIPATFDRLASNVESQTRGSRRMKALSAVIDRPWLRNLLPRRATLLRAPKLQHIVVEDWLLDNRPSEPAAEPEMANAN